VQIDVVRGLAVDFATGQTLHKDLKPEFSQTPLAAERSLKTASLLS
jgi:hypothetical protein